MKSKVVTLAICALAAGSAFGTVSLNFNAEFDTGVPQNLANAAGTPSNGLIWGVLVDGSGNGITRLTTKYDLPAGGLVLGSTYILSVSGVPTDDVLTIATALTSDTSGSTEGDGTTPGGVGGIYDITVNYTNGVTVNDPFYVVWFSGSVGGTLGDASFVIPADGSPVSLGNPFEGVDPIRTAGLGYTGTSSTSTAAGIAFVPEPSAALLGALGALGLLRRRRN